MLEQGPPMSPKTLQRAKAYSYVRFSTPEQAEGDSHRRQTEKAQRYATENGLELQTSTFEDLGLSAFHGKNVETGALGIFLDGAPTGTIPKGSYLLVESLDRISRQTARKAVRALEDLVDAGIIVVDLSDGGGRTYSTEVLDTDQFAFVMMTLRFIRAHEESTMKSARVAAAFDRKRKAATGKGPHLQPFTRMLPGWLLWNEDLRKHEVIKARVTVLKGTPTGEGG